MTLIIGLTGTLGSGKGTVVDYLIENAGFVHFSVRSFLIEEIKRRNLPVDRDSMTLVANDLRENNSSSYLAEQLYLQASKQDKPAIIESIRTPGEVEALRKKGDFYLLAVNADSKVRYNRIVLRASETDKVSFERFLANERREMQTSDPNKQNLSGCIDIADFTIDNSGSLTDFNTQINTVFSLISDSIEKKYAGLKRTDNISWDDYFMGLAMLSAMRSKDPSSQVGACIVDPKNRIVATGYNGWPRGIDDDLLPWTREGSPLEKKYRYVVHAEANAITNATTQLDGCRLYVALFPCSECAKLIIQSGIREVIFIADKHSDLDTFIASRKLLYLADVKTRKFIPTQESLLVDFDKINK